MLRSDRFTRRSSRSALRSLTETAPGLVAVPDLALRLSPDSCCVYCSHVSARRSSWSSCVRCLQVPFVIAPVRLALESSSDPLAPAHCDVSPGTATADQSVLVAPASAHPADHLSCGSPRSAAPCAHAPRSLH